MFLLDLDPNVIKPGWTPAIITLALLIALVLLYLSMRRQMRKISVVRTGEPTDPPAEPPSANAG